jgi:hypothetical protein
MSHWILRYVMGVVLVICALGLPSAPRAATVPAGFTETIAASGLASPTAMEFAPDGRLFVTEQGGRLRVIKNGVLLPAPFATLTVNASGERGLLGVTFDPNFATNNFVYVYYTATTPNVHNRISRFTANGDVAVAGSEVVILDLNPLSSATNHNGGAIHFGEDGKLYVAVGDNANGGNAQSLTNLLGKMLRLNPDGSIPTDNPFFGQATGVNRAIWALGLRNPFTFSIESITGRMLINDVGQNTWEEINEGVVARIMDGRTPKGRPATFSSARPCTPTSTAPERPPDARSRAAPSTTRWARSSFRQATTAITSLPTIAAVGSTGSRRRVSPPRSSPRASRRPWT